MFLDRLSLVIGKFSSWLLFFMMLVCCIVVVLRYGFNIGSTTLQDILMYLHGCAFLLGAAYTLSMDDHVRVDIFYRHFNVHQKAWVDALGTSFILLPLCAFLLWFGWHYFYTAWQFKEGSAEPGGLPYVYLLKGIIPLAFLLLFIQALGCFLKAANTLVFRRD